ncbi:adenine-specific DNA-methyltransferase [Streptomyces sp. 846.5]|nr:site-specific DNA-methyltransferase [Streptomyces sp. 846.5]TDU06631.1 adenine-specific DNA-methyltransferase [Streptomyces sp. 846.5]
MDDTRNLDELSREELLKLLEERPEAGISLGFAGKETARTLARKVRPRVQRTVNSLSAGSERDRARNLLLEGDNLHALVTLYRERGQVDLIVTDPPYNTGNDFRYNDKWDSDPNNTDLGDWVSADDGARHTKWMKLMLPRLQMMKSMLKPTGVLAICIDHRELFHLGQMLDELFGERNRIAIINWQKITSPKNHDHGVSTATEYVLVYANNEDLVQTGRLPHSTETAKSYRSRDGDPLGEWAPSDSTLMGASTHPGQVYGIQNPFTGKLHYPQEGRCWRNERSKMKAGVEEWGIEYEDREVGDGLRPALLIRGAKNPLTSDYSNDRVVKRAQKIVEKHRETQVWPRFFWRDDQRRQAGHGELRYKTYLADVAKGVVPTTFWANDDFEPIAMGATSWEHPQSGTSETGVGELNAVVGRGHGFDTVKPLMLMRKIISLWCPTDGLVLDPFAGSGTTGHAVLALNHEMGADRQFILIEQGRPERGDSYAKTLTAKRLANAVTGKWANKKGLPLGGGFQFSELTKQVDAETLLKMERDEMRDTVLASYHDSSRRRGPRIEKIDDPSCRHLVGKNTDNEGFFLIWDGPTGNTDLTEDVYEECALEAEQKMLEPFFHVYARRELFRTDNVNFLQIPERILVDFGLDLRTDAFSESDDL